MEDQASRSDHFALRPLQGFPPIAFASPGLIVYLIQALGQHALFIDDSYIFYRYAANWADGHGPVFNLSEKVEGYSSLLWTAMLALGAVLSVPPPDLAPLLGLALGAASILLIFRLAQMLLPECRLMWALVPLAAALSSGFAAFAISGMDTILFTFVLLAAVASAAVAVRSGRIGMLTVVLVLLVVARVEGAVYATALLAVLAVLLRARQVAFDASGFLRVVAIVVLVFLVQEAGRLIYYGDLLPATVTAKGYATDGLVGAIESGFTDWGQLENALFLGFKYERAILVMAMLPLAGLALRHYRHDRQSAIAWLIAAPIIVNLGITAWASGDWMPLQRLNIAVLPLILLLVAWELTQVLDEVQSHEPRMPGPGLARSRLALVGLIVLVVGSYSIERSLMRPAIANVTHPREEGYSLFSRQVGDLVAQAEPAPAILTDVVGKTGYYAGPKAHVWDMLGLTDEHNAKHGELWRPRAGRSDDAYNFSRPFDVLMTDNVAVLERALAYWQAHPESNGPVAYEVLPNQDWLEGNFFVITRTEHPISLMLEALCACSPVGLTTSFVRDQRTRVEPP